MFIQSVIKAAVIGIKDETRLSELVAEIVLNLTRIRHNGLIVLSPCAGTPVEVVFDLQKYDDEGRAILEVSVADYRMHDASYGITDDTAQKTPLGAKHYPRQEWFKLSGSADESHCAIQVPQGFSVTQFLHIVKNRLAAALFPGNRITGINLIHPKVEDDTKGPWVLCLVPGVEANPWKTLTKIHGTAAEILYNIEDSLGQRGAFGSNVPHVLLGGPLDIEFYFKSCSPNAQSGSCVHTVLQIVQRHYINNDERSLGVDDRKQAFTSWLAVTGESAVTSGFELPYGMSSLQLVQLIFDQLISVLVPMRIVCSAEILNSDGKANGADTSREIIASGGSSETPVWTIRLHPGSKARI